MSCHLSSQWARTACILLTTVVLSMAAGCQPQDTVTPPASITIIPPRMPPANGVNGDAPNQTGGSSTTETSAGTVRRHFDQPPTAAHPLGRQVNGPEAAGRFVTALCHDRFGNLWIASEGNGIVCRLANGEWRQFTVESCGAAAATSGPVLAEGPSGPFILPENTCTSIAADRQNRIWVGTLYHGVAVYNGERWRTYDVTDGPLGSRVFDLAVCTLTGDVWIATDQGLSRYSDRQPADERSGGFRLGNWTYFTRSHGLASDQIRTVAVAADGVVYAGTDCDGLSIGTPEDAFENWRHVAVQAGEADRAVMGTGIPSGQINDILVTANQQVYVATSAGIGRSKDAGATWEFLRGRDFVDKVENRATPAPRGWKRPPLQQMDQLLPEDYATSLTEDANGQVWVGFRRQGVAVFGDGNSMHVRPGRAGFRSDFVCAVLVEKSGEIWCGGRGNGLEKVPTTLVPAIIAGAPSALAPAQGVLPRHPTPAPVPTEAQVRSLISTAAPAQPGPGQAFYEGDDWTTGGDWLANYGRLHAVLWAMVAPLDQEFMDWNGPPQSEILGRIGPHCRKGDELRRSLHWKVSQDHRALFSPRLGHRRQADCDDHGEDYPMHHEGPDLWFRVKVPAGTYRLSWYFFNKDGESGPGRFRDYLISIFKYRPEPALAEKTPVLAQSRVADFRGGVYKRFRVTGPADFFVKVARNSSFNTICSGTFLDRIGPEGLDVRNRWTDDLRDPPQRVVTGAFPDGPAPPLAEAATQLWEQSEIDGSCSESARGDRLRRVIAYRVAQNVPLSLNDQTIMRRKLSVWSEADRQLMAETYRTVAQGLTKEAPARP